MLPWLPIRNTQPEVVARDHEVMTMSDGRRVADLSSVLVSTMFADNHHLDHVRLDDMASLPPQYRYAPREEASRRLIDMFPVDGATAAVWWTCTGSEALSTAIWASTRATGAPGVFTMDHSYHGSGVHTAQFGTDPRNLVKRSNHIVTVETPTLPRPQTPEDCAKALAVSDRLFESHPHAKTLVVEGSSGSALGAPWPDRYLEELVKLARGKHRIQVVLDEIMSGLQRCGSGLHAAAMRGASDDFEVDFVCAGKALTNGALPVAVTVVGDATEFEEDAWGHGSTFSGYRAGVDATAATLDRLDAAGPKIDALEADIREMAREVVDIPVVADVRGNGLLWTIELNAPGHYVNEFKWWLEWGGGVRIFGQQNRLLLAPSLDGLETAPSLEKLADGIHSYFYSQRLQ